MLKLRFFQDIQTLMCCLYECVVSCKLITVHVFIFTQGLLGGSGLTLFRDVRVKDKLKLKLHQHCTKGLYDSLNRHFY